MEDAVTSAVLIAAKPRTFPDGEDACISVDLYGSLATQTGGCPTPAHGSARKAAEQSSPEGVCSNAFLAEVLRCRGGPARCREDPRPVRRLRLFGWGRCPSVTVMAGRSTCAEGSARKTFLSRRDGRAGHQLVLAERTREARDVIAQSRTTARRWRGCHHFAEIDILPPIRTVPRRGARRLRQDPRRGFLCVMIGAFFLYAQVLPKPGSFLRRHFRAPGARSRSAVATSLSRAWSRTILMGVEPFGPVSLPRGP